MITLWAVLQILVVVGCALVLWRNMRVHHYRMELLRRIKAANDRERRTAAGGLYDWRLRYEWFGRVSHEEMVWKFWRPLGSFYPDVHEFAPPEEEGPCA